MTYLLDVNALLALGLREHVFHERVAAWVRDAATVKKQRSRLAQSPNWGFYEYSPRLLPMNLR